MQGAAVLAGLQLVIKGTCPMDRTLPIEHDPRMDLGLPFVHLGQATVQNLHARGLTCAQGAAESGNRLRRRGEEIREWSSSLRHGASRLLRVQVLTGGFSGLLGLPDKIL